MGRGREDVAEVGRLDHHRQDGDVIIMFDVDNTLTPHRQNVSPEVEECLECLRERYPVGLVSGSDLSKIQAQLGVYTDIFDRFEYVFTENGMVAHRHGKLIGEKSIVSKYGEDTIQDVINFALLQLSQIRLPVKRGNFIEYRTGIVNVCPIGRACSQAQRQQFVQYDKKYQVRKELVEEFEKEFPDLGLKFTITGQTSVDIYPRGWDKRICLDYLQRDGYKHIYFFGDSTHEGGNDFEILRDPRVTGYTVTSPSHTVQLIKEIFPEILSPQV